MHQLDIDVKNAIADGLLDWYATARRDLPWRRLSADPYAVWVSEIMLQQTTVAAVGPFYERWMAAFPTVRHLAEAPLDDVLKLWAGLGYYARARNLHRAAKKVVNEFSCVVPRDRDAIRTLPGIGPYTAGAILSVAYNADEAIVDTNVIRVLTRVFAISGDPKSNSVTTSTLWSYARELIPKGKAADFNQSLMELGALVCEPANPKCDACPLTEVCIARQAGDPTRYPELKPKAAWTACDDVAVVVRNDRGELVLAKRPASASLWGGLWELPRATRERQEGLEECASRVLGDTLGMFAMTLCPFGTVSHVVAKRKITLHGFIAKNAGSLHTVDDERAEPRVVREHRALYGAATTCGENDGSRSVRNGRPAPYEEVAWVAATASANYAMSTPQVRLLAELARFEEQGRLFDDVI